MEVGEASRDAKFICPPPRFDVTAAAASSHVGLAQRQRKVTASSYGSPLHATPRVQALVSPQVAYALELRKSCAFAHVHRASRRGRLTDHSSALSLNPRADRRSRPSRRKVEGATPRAQLCARGPVSAGRRSAAGSKRAPDIVHLRRPQRADLSAEERSRHPAGPGRRASGAADTVRCPPAHLSPRSRPVAPPTSELPAPHQPPARWREGPERQ